MGAKGRNFYNDLAGRYGYEAEAEEVQDLYLSGDKAAAIAAVPDGLVDEISLIGTKEMVRDRLDVFRDAGVTTILVSSMELSTLRTLAELMA